jgi:hypothetical protein
MQSLTGSLTLVHGLTDRVEQIISMITPCLPHRKSTQAHVLDEVTLSRERAFAVVRDPGLVANVVERGLHVIHWSIFEDTVQARQRTDWLHVS